MWVLGLGAHPPPRSIAGRVRELSRLRAGFTHHEHLPLLDRVETVVCPFSPSRSAFKPRQCSASRDQLCRSCVCAWPPAALMLTQTSGLSSWVWPQVCLNTVGLLVYQWMASNANHWLWPWSWPRLTAPQSRSLLVRLPELQQGHLSCATWLWSSKNLSKAENKSQGLRKEGHCSLYREKPHLGPAQELV